MSCARRERTGTCSHYQCPFRQATSHGYACVDVVDHYCEVGEGCLADCPYSWRLGDTETRSAAFEAFERRFPRKRPGPGVTVKQERPQRLQPRYIRAHFAGALESRINRRTGTTVTLYRAHDAELDEDAGPYATVCEQHGAVVHHRSRSVARSWLAAPDEWCEQCAELHDALASWSPVPDQVEP
jgi:hypothetical protein